MPPPRPRIYYLNETHELSVEEKGGGGKHVEYRIDWKKRSTRLHSSLMRVAEKARRSPDPLSNKRFYMIADPAPEVVKASEAKDAVGGEKVETVNFRGEHAKVFERLGLDLVTVFPSGNAVIHALPERIDQLVMRTSELPSLGSREQNRFVAIEEFSWIPSKLKFDSEWIDEIGSKETEGYIKLQPLITDLEADAVFRALEEIFRASKESVSLRGKGKSYLGRFFLRAILNAGTIKRIAENFTSVEAIHPPIIALTAAPAEEIKSKGSPAAIVASTDPLPCVGVVDTAIPSHHAHLAAYRRGIVTGLGCLNTENDNHGSMVASRIVFGDMDFSRAAAPPKPSCRFFEVRVAQGSERIRSDSVSGALAAAVTAAPDLRVFNLSFDKPIDGIPATQRAAALRHVEEIDNFAFDQDVILVIAAGNVRDAVPTTAYPNHYVDPLWRLQSYPRAFNALTCGGVAHRLTANGLSPEVDAPSPFARVGPGFADSPKPDLADSAGNLDTNYERLPGGGVWGYSALGDGIERIGTSYAAPLLARQAAFMFAELKDRCPAESQPFACTVKAALALTADDLTSRLSPNLQPLAKLTVGYGRADVGRFRAVTLQRARFIWQGVIEHTDDIVRVQIPLPADWLTEATAPRLQMCVAWNTPVNAAVEDLWSCRDVNVTLRPTEDADGVRGGLKRVSGYPLYKRLWKLEKAVDQKIFSGDTWIAEFKYLQVAPYAAGHIVAPPQKVSFGAEIWDEGEDPVEPHSFIQALPIAATMNRMSNTAAWLPQSIAITSDF